MMKFHFRSRINEIALLVFLLLLLCSLTSSMTILRGLSSSIQRQEQEQQRERKLISRKCKKQCIKARNNSISTCEGTCNRDIKKKKKKIACRANCIPVAKKQFKTCNKNCKNKTNKNTKDTTVCPNQDPNKYCMEDYKPVTCGSDTDGGPTGCTYGNSCKAIAAGWDVTKHCVSSNDVETRSTTDQLSNEGAVVECRRDGYQCNFLVPVPSVVCGQQQCAYGSMCTAQNNGYNVEDCTEIPLSSTSP